MYESVSPEGLARLVRLELNRSHPQTRDEARRMLIGRMGAYSGSALAIQSGLDAYFAGRALS